MKSDKAALQAFIVSLKHSNPDERERLLSESVDQHGKVRLPKIPEDISAPGSQDGIRQQGQVLGGAETPGISSDDELDISHFISVDDTGKHSSFGPSSSLHNPVKSGSASTPTRESIIAETNIKNGLIANAAIQRQREPELKRLSTIGGISTDLALHLLNIHWTRQHHSFLLTYRPVVMQDLQCVGPYCSYFMLNAIFACSSKYSGRLEVRDDPNDPGTAGHVFFRRCDESIVSDGLLARPAVPTVVGLLLLGSTYNARGEISKGWLWTGYALRMVYDLGLHLDPRQTTDNPEEIEIRRRVFWGAFVCDKLQSLYLGRPVAINLRDSQVSRDFFDLYEEKEPFQGSGPGVPQVFGESVPMYSVSTFQHLCLLSKIMTTIINRFYVVGAALSNARNSLHQVDKALQQWRDSLSPDLDFQPWLTAGTEAPAPRQPPNVMILHNLYYSMIILVHRPFISDGHLRTAGAPMHSWERCTVAASRITSIALTYKSVYSLRAAPYVLGYTIYVACTIHVRNAASQDQPGEHMSLLTSSLGCLDELCQANAGVAKPANIIRRLIEVNKLDLPSATPADVNQSSNSLNAYPESMATMEQSSFNFDMDAILSMFPVNNGAVPDFSMPGYRVGYDYEMPTDPLFGMMDGPGTGFDL